IEYPGVVGVPVLDHDPAGIRDTVWKASDVPREDGREPAPVDEGPDRPKIDVLLQLTPGALGGVEVGASRVRRRVLLALAPHPFNRDPPGDPVHYQGFFTPGVPQALAAQ